MTRGRIRRTLYTVCVLAALALPSLAAAAAYHGQVTFGGFPVPGATVTLTQGERKLTTVSDQSGLYHFADLPDGSWQVEVEMQCFATVRAEVSISPNTAPAKWELTLLAVDQILASSKLPSAPLPAPGVVAPTHELTAPASPNDNALDMPKPPDDAAQQASDGFLVNGSVNNAATSQFSLDRAFGNRRTNSKSLYNGGLAAILDTSVLDARPYSLSGLDSPKATYNRITGVLTFGGPIKIPHLLPHGPNSFLVYQWTRDRIAENESGLVPTAAERTGDLSGVLNALGQPVAIFNPATGLPFPGNLVPVSPQAQALLRLYPLPKFASNSLYNYQVPVLNSSHQDALQLRVDKTLGRKDQLYGGFNLMSNRASGSNLFGFTDTTDMLGINSNINWAHRFSQRLFVYSGYRFSRLRTHLVPYFENRDNLSASAGISGNDQDAANWGPPALTFSSGITALTDQQSSFNRNRTDGFSASIEVYRGHHNITAGGDLRRQQYNDFFQQNPRGSFTFTGAATQLNGNGGSALADFLLGVPDTSSIAFGNADKYLRQPVYDAYITDDWRVLSVLTVNAGLRWEYGAPITELHGRLVNLDLAPGFSAAAPVLAGDPVGSLTGSRYPRSLIRPDRRGFEPRIGVSWRPIAASTIVVRAGYGIYHDSSVYQTSALDLAQQAPLSKSMSVQNSTACPLTLANGFNACSATTSSTFAVDPSFKVGYAQTWQLSVQRDLPEALQLTATYLGVKGTRGVQEFLPNTYPIGAVNPCPACPLGFLYETSGGNSTRQSAQIQLRRRLRDGFTAALLYTFSKSIDDDAMLGGQGHVTASAQTQGAAGATPSSAQGPGNAGSLLASQPSSTDATAAIAQNWRDLRAERSLSSFDQRHLLTLQAQYTTGEGLGGGTLMSGWRGRMLKEWTLLAQVGAGTGLPETPIYLASVPETGFTGTIRPDRSGTPVNRSHSGSHLNAAAYAAPTLGQWGFAGRYSITGPSQFSLDGSLARTFRPNARFYLDARLSATNLLNHVVFTGWNTTVNSTQFGLPVSSNPMRSLDTTLRLRF